ncbi:hypothetical protein [Cyclobacterium plantarum]|uniref:hypothetical protein n=1 Tax=Cyclobacterium plantarum TaxID=2716263 RepID=UPI003F706C1A
MKTTTTSNNSYWDFSMQGSLILILNLIQTLVFGQQLEFRTQTLPPSPEVSAFAKFADTRISHYSGIPDINIPLYTIVEQDLEIPINMSYHAGGIRVEERAGWAGLGWVLNAGGNISRTMKGIPDEHNLSQSGYINHKVVPDQLSTNEMLDYYQRNQNGLIDFEQDIFHFAFGNYFGKFVLDKSGEVAFLSANNLKIQFDQINRNIIRWKVWDEFGNLFIFEEEERTITEDISDSKSAPYRSNFYSAWHLSKIITYSGREIIFNYEGYTETYYSRSVQSASYFLSGSTGRGVCGTDKITDGFSEVTVRGKQLVSIQFGLGKIELEGQNDRQDASAKRLSGLKVISNQGRLIKSFSFDHDYYRSTQSNQNINLPGFIARATPNKRLRLLSIRENTANPELVYQMEYQGDELPHLFSYSQDHWGFYNAWNNQSLIPQYLKFRKANANRLVVPEKAVIGSLKKITYPTGGSITYEMESNQAVVSSGEYFNFFSPVVLEEDQPLYSVSVNQQNTKAIFLVEPQESDTDEHKLIQYNVHLNDLRDCDGRGKDCIGSLDIYLYSPSEKTFISLLSNNIKKGSITGTLWLKAGTEYQLHLEGPSRLIAGVSASVSGRKNPPKQEETGQIEVNVGGLRVKAITKDFGNQTETIQYRYEQGEESISSGSLASFPKYDFVSFNTLIERVPDRNDVVVDHCLKFELRSYSQVPLSTSANFFGYANVKEIRENEQGQILRTDYQYLSPKDFPDQTQYHAPIGIIRTNEAKRGVPIKEIYFAHTEEGFKKSKEFVYSYQPSERDTHENFVFSCMGYGPRGCQDVRLLKYYNTTVWNPQIEIKEISYEIETGASFEKSSQTNYDENYLLPVRKTLQLSNSENLEENYFYTFNLPVGFSNSGEQELLSDLKEANRIAPIIAQTKKNAGQLVEQQYIRLKRLQDRVLPAGLVKKHGDHAEYQELSIISYDSFGNIQEQQARTGPIQTFLWDERGFQLLATVQNAPIEEVCYTSFESADKSGWAFSGEPYPDKSAKTGNNLYHLGRGSISKSNIPADKDRVFLLSFWAKKTSSRTSGAWTFMGKTEMLTDEWQLVQREVTDDQVTLAGQGVLVDEIRLHPKDAFMETYTHEPLLGISSKTDQRHHTSYYEYDAMGRLATIRNMDRDILEHYAYTYPSLK